VIVYRAFSHGHVHQVSTLGSAATANRPSFASAILQSCVKELPVNQPSALDVRCCHVLRDSLVGCDRASACVGTVNHTTSWRGCDAVATGLRRGSKGSREFIEF
jgi:hypothetical protein